MNQLIFNFLKFREELLKNRISNKFINSETLKKKYQDKYNKKELIEVLKSINPYFFKEITNYISNLQELYCEIIEVDKIIDFIIEYTEFYCEIVDPLFLNKDNPLQIISGDIDGIEYTYKNLFNFKLIFDVSEIKNKELSFFDILVGLDKQQSNIIFINIDITNLITNTTFTYKFTKGEELKYENDICKDQLNFVLETIMKTFLSNIYSVLIDFIVLYHFYTDEEEYSPEIIKNVILENKEIVKLWETMDI